MTIPGYLDAEMRAQASVKAWETRRGGPPLDHRRTITLYLPSEHYKHAVEDEAEARGMSVASFMRAMIRGYFAAALHGR